MTKLRLSHYPDIAILYTTCNDFIEKSVQSCVDQDYKNFKVYILDDSRQPEYKLRIDTFASKYPKRVVVVRRPDKKGFKAGNMNFELTHFATDEPYFAIADADEILPRDFLLKLVPVIESDDSCGFVRPITNPIQKTPVVWQKQWASELTSIGNITNPYAMHMVL